MPQDAFPAAVYINPDLVLHKITKAPGRLGCGGLLGQRQAGAGDGMEMEGLGRTGYGQEPSRPQCS